ncbi:LOW QUALITY PROTEIN: hypothetical protein PanWU01x14_168420 [Parasponia andersonii]|uniref:Uncharacterized protein n=1 Tax=Parasponia andersonii TaxID=3476 RepID=A0A2P5CB23_PARAD|nr:LOW QUALITY PROTEIN: hypothetical protein PanWU01x14_168420 [Parasponia andersonii]
MLVFASLVAERKFKEEDKIKQKETQEAMLSNLVISPSTFCPCLPHLPFCRETRTLSHSFTNPLADIWPPKLMLHGSGLVFWSLKVSRMAMLKSSTHVTVWTTLLRGP